MAKENKVYMIPDEIWKQIEPLLSPELPNSNGNHLKMGNREAMETTLCGLRSGFGGDLELSDTVYSRFKEWRDAGVFQRMWKAGLLEYSELRVLFWYRRRHIRR